MAFTFNYPDDPDRVSLFKILIIRDDGSVWWQWHDGDPDHNRPQPADRAEVQKCLKHLRREASLYRIASDEVAKVLGRMP